MKRWERESHFQNRDMSGISEMSCDGEQGTAYMSCSIIIPSDIIISFTLYICTVAC